MTLSQKDAGKQYFVDTEADLVKTDWWLLGPSSLELRIIALEEDNSSLNRLFLDLFQQVYDLKQTNIKVPGGTPAEHEHGHSVCYGRT
jgi:hypothetical protein